MKMVRIAAPALGLALIGFAGTAHGASFGQQANYNQNQQQPNYNTNQQQPGYNQNQQPGYGQGQRYGQGQGGWDAPPNDFRDVQRQGFHDGIEAARQDFQTQRQRPPEAHRQFARPGVAPELRNDYRDGFRKGYSVAIQHLQNGDRRDGYPR